MNIDDFVQSNRGSDRRLLQRLYAYFCQHQGDRAFDIDGLTLLDIGPYGGTMLYHPRMTPANTLTFATTGGDDVHFGMLSREGLFGDASPVIMTVPMADDNAENANFVVGETLHDFLCLGCVHGFFALEQLAYSKSELFEQFALAPDTDADPSYARFRSAFLLAPWTEIESRQRNLDRKYKAMLEFRKTQSED